MNTRFIGRFTARDNNKPEGSYNPLVKDFYFPHLFRSSQTEFSIFYTNTLALKTRIR